MEAFSNKINFKPVDNTLPIKVLVVEDHNLSAHIAERFLTDLGCQVDCAPDGATAELKFFEKNQEPYDLVFMDVSLPDMEGYALAEKFKKAIDNEAANKQTIHIIALTARGGEENKQRCLLAGMSAVIVKPLLKTTAREILQKYTTRWDASLFLQKPQHSDVIAWNIEGEPINFDYALTIHDGDINFIKSALQVVVDNLVVEIKHLRSECTAKHWDAGRVIIHKLQGGTRYFGLVRLDQVCERFTTVLKQNPIDHWYEMYNVLVSEVEKVRCVYEKWLKDLQTSSEN